MGVRHPALFKSVAEHLVGTNDGPEITGRGVEKFSPQGMGNLAWAFARQAQLGAEVMERRGRNTVTGSGVTGRLAQYSTICNDIGEFLLQKLFHAIAEADLKVHGTSYFKQKLETLLLVADERKKASPLLSPFCL